METVERVIGDSRCEVRRLGARVSILSRGVNVLLRIEWPTVALAVGLYLGFGLVTFAYELLPWWLVLPAGAFLVCLHGSLQHEAVHLHPTPWPWVNELLVFPSLWLWLPFRLYREQHLQHHATPDLTDPASDPESYYLPETAWRGLPSRTRAFYWMRNSLLGRLVLGPAEAVLKTYRSEARRLVGGDTRHLGHWLVHFAGVAPVLYWVQVVCEIPLIAYLLLFAYPGLALTLLRSFLEHRADPAPGRRTVVIEAEPVFALLFLNNNLHALHHAEPQQPWYRLPGRYRSEKARLLAENGGYFFTGYLEIFRRYLLNPKESPCFPAAPAR